MNGVVIDCSVTMSWCFEDEANAFADWLHTQLGPFTGWVPALWPFEVANVLAIGERRGRITMADSLRFLAMLRQLPIEVDDRPPRDGVQEVLRLARTYRLTAYDAAYLELAQRSALPLATLDEALRGVAQALGIRLFSA